MFDMDHKENRYRDFLTDWSFVQKWCARIAQLPDFVIEHAVDRIPSGLIHPNADERAALKQFLVRRKAYLLEHIRRWATLFPALNPE